MSWLISSDIRRWYVVFWRKNVDNARWWQRAFWEDWWAIGGYRHVSCFGYSPEANAWVHFNPQPDGMHFRIVTNDDHVDLMISILMQCGSVVVVPHNPRKMFPKFAPFNCVSAVKHCIGARCGAYTPASLRRYCLTIGQEIENDVRETNPVCSNPVGRASSPR